MPYKHILKTALSLVITGIISTPTSAETWVVTSTNDARAYDDFGNWTGGYEPGTYRWAVEQLRNAGAGPHRIEFNIPGEGPHIISPSCEIGTDYPKIVRPVHIDGFSQPGSSPGNVQIVLDDQNDCSATGVAMDINEAGGDGSIIQGIAFVNWTKGSDAVGAVNSNAADNITVKGCYFGFYPDGTPGPNKVGIIFQNTGNHQIGGPDPEDRNFIGHNTRNGIVFNYGDNNSVIENNWIGLDVFGNPAGNGGDGILIRGSNNIIRDNVVQHNDGDGISSAIGSVGNYIYGNDFSNNGIHGVEFLNGDTHSNVVGMDENGNSAPNIISYNGGHGVYVAEWCDNGCQYGSAYQTTIRFNEIFCNGLEGISLGEQGAPGNNGIGSNTPVINTTLSNATQIVGSNAPANSTVDLYGVELACFDCPGGGTGQNEGRHYLGSTTADGGGNWEFDCGSGNYGVVVAAATNGAGNTTEFSEAFDFACTSPNPEITLDGPEEICQGQNAAYTATAQDMGDDPIFTFYLNGVEQQSGTSPNFSTTDLEPTVASIEVVVTEDVVDPCFEPKELREEIWTSVLDGLPAPDAGDDVTICEGETHTLGGTLADDYTDYEWSHDGNGTLTGTNSLTPTYTPDASDSGNNITITLTASGNCNDQTGEMVITVSPLPEPELIDRTICDGGTALLNPGTFETYLWSDDSEDATLSTSISGDYSVTVTNAAGCEASDDATVSISNDLVIDDIDLTPITCNNADDAIAEVVFSGGQSPYKFEWSDGAMVAENGDLGPGAYGVTVTDANGCTIADDITIDEPAAITVTDVTTDVSCFEGTDGRINLTSAGGTGELSFIWSNGSAIEDLTNLAANTYTVTVSDENGCQEILTTEVDQPTAINITLTPQTASCGAEDGAVTAAVSGGTPDYLYNWSNGAQTQNLTAIGAGNYSLTVEDDNGCLETASSPVNEQTDMAVTLTPTDILCNAETTGSISNDVTGGATPYTFEWTDGSADQNLTDVGSGDYVVTVTDANGCRLISSATISEPEPLAVDDATTHNLCADDADGTIDLTVSGGTPGYNFTWSNGSANEDLTNLSAGNYSSTITDANGCEITYSVEITEPEPLIAFVVDKTNVSEVGLADGTGEVSGGGGTAPYSYEWETGHDQSTIDGLARGEYTFTVTDANGCEAEAILIILEFPIILTFEGENADCYGECDLDITITSEGGQGAHSYLWEDGRTSTYVDNLCAGTYFVTVTDEVGQREIGSYTLTQPSEIQANTTTTNALCFAGFSGTASATASGGNPAYTYNWSTGQQSESIADLSAGDYDVSITDINGCAIVETVTIEEPQAIVIDVFPSPALCEGSADGDIDAAVIGGTSPYNYAWSNGAVTQDVTGLNADAYTLTVTDANGCTQMRTTAITEPVAMELTATSLDAGCQGAASGALLIDVANGTAPYQYSWSTGATTEDLEGVVASTYDLTVTDANGCEETTSGIVNEPNTMTIIPAASDASCFDRSDAGVQLEVIAENGPVTYQWSNATNDANLANVPAGNYAVSITDANQCTVIRNFTLNEPEPIVVTATTEQPTVCLGARQALEVSATGGTAPYTFEWTHDGTISDENSDTPTVQPSEATVYGVAAFDNNGCYSLTTIELDIYPPVLIDLAVTDDNICEGETTNLVSAASSGNGSYSYTWTQAGVEVATSPLLDVSPDSTMYFAASVVDGCNQIATDSLLVTVNPIPEPELTITMDTACNHIDLNLTNNGIFMEGATCQWNYGDGTTSSISCYEMNTHRYIEEGKYLATLSMTSPAGCTYSDEMAVQVTFPPRPVAYFTADPMVQAVPESTVEFTNLSTEAIEYNWSFGDGNAALDEHPTHSYDSLNPGKYTTTLHVVSRYGCEDTHSELIEIRGTYGLYVPTAFTPNNDNKNDYFLPVSFGFDEMEYLIFDRWGEMIFKGQHMTDFWDGTMPDGSLAKSDVYTWKLTGNSEWASEVIEEIGRVTLVR